MRTERGLKPIIIPDESQAMKFEHFYGTFALYGVLVVAAAILFAAEVATRRRHVGAGDGQHPPHPPTVLVVLPQVPQGEEEQGTQSVGAPSPSPAHVGGKSSRWGYGGATRMKTELIIM